MKYLSQYIICFFMCILFACQSEIDKFDVNHIIAPGDYNDALKLVQDLQIDHAISSQTKASINLNNVVIQFSANSFVHLNGGVVTGDVVVSSIVIKEKRDFIKYNIACEDGSGMRLSSEATLHLSASQNGVALKLNDQVVPPKIFIIDETIESAAVYLRDNGQENYWEKNNIVLQSGPISYSINGMQFDEMGYTFDLIALGWVSVQKELQISNFISVCLKLSDSNTPNNTLAYLISDNKNSCQQLMVSSSGECAMTDVPDELEGTIVVVAHKGLLMGEEHLEAQSRRVLITNGQAHFEMMPTDMDIAEFTAFIQSL